MLWIHLHIHVDTIARTQTITCYDVHWFIKLEICCINEIRELTMTDISCELLQYGSADLCTEISKKVFGAVHRFMMRLADCNL